MPHVTIGHADEPTMDAALRQAARLDLRATVAAEAITAYSYDDEERRLAAFTVALASR